MKSKSPEAAVRLLNYLDDSHYFESMIGDLEEFSAEGRSLVWYWRQTLIAVGHRFAGNVWTQKMPALKVLIAAWAFMPLYNLARLFALKALVMAPLAEFGRVFGLSVFATSFDAIPKSLGQGMRTGGTAYLFAACPILILIAWLFGAGTAWLVTRVHRERHPTMVLLYAASILATVLPNICNYAVAAYDNQSFGSVSHLFIYSANNTALLAGIVVEGLLRRRREPPQNGIAAKPVAQSI